MAGRPKKALGRGLSALLEDNSLLSSSVDVAEPRRPVLEGIEVEDGRERIRYIDIDMIKPNSRQPRKFFDDEALEGLAASIEEHGVISPILVRPLGEGFELVAGERRWRAARQAGLTKIPAIVRELDERENMLFALIENMQREDLNPIEEASGLSEMIERFNLTQEQVAESVGKSRPYVTNSLRLLKLPIAVREMIIDGSLSAGHGRAIAGIKSEDAKIECARKAAAGGWSVRQIEVYAGKKKTKTGSARRRRVLWSSKEDALRIGRELGSVLGTKVVLKGDENRGRIELEYYSRGELERLIELLGSK